MPALGKLVAVRYQDGRLAKGWTADFKPACSQFHIRLEDQGILQVQVKNLKAVFFIRTLEGDPNHDQVNDFSARKVSEKKVWIEFKDGEQLAGWSSALGGATGFYFTPTDPESNLERVFVYRSAVKRILQGKAAEEAVRKNPAPASGRDVFGGRKIYDIG